MTQLIARKRMSFATDDDQEGLLNNPDEQILAKVQEALLNNGTLDFSAARRKVLKMNPELAEAYKNHNDQ